MRAPISGCVFYFIYIKMKKLLITIYSLIILFSIPTYAQNNGLIEHIWWDTILSYNWESITIHDKNIYYDTQKCPVWYHIWTADDWATIIKIWWNLKWSNYNFMDITSDGYYISEDYSADERWDWGNQLWWLSTFISDVFNTKQISSVSKYYKTSSYWDKHQPYIFVFNNYSSYWGRPNWEEKRISWWAWLSTCDKIYIENSCDKKYLARCFKDKTNSPSNNWYSKEYNDAYIFAYNNKITTMETIEKANMYWEIKRMEIAKMFANWVKNFWFYQDPNIPCNFTDTSSVKWDLATAIIESCRYWIMWQWITKFRPNDKITRAEVATAISRILRWHKYDGWTPYYINHIDALKEAWVISDATNAKTNELRWNVMVMLMKANDILKYNFINCETPEYLLLCTNDKEKCPEKCKK